MGSEVIFRGRFFFILLLSAATLSAQGRGGRGGDGAGAPGQGIAPGLPPGQRWVRLAPVPEPNEERNGVVASGKLYLFGGNPVGLTGTPPGSVLEYDAAGDKWTKKKNMPLAAHHVAVAENGGKIYVFGGGVQKQAGGGAYVPANLSVGSVVLADTEIYGDLSVLTPAGWRPMEEIGIPLMEATATRDARFNYFPLDAALVSRAAEAAELVRQLGQFPCILYCDV